VAKRGGPGANPRRCAQIRRASTAGGAIIEQIDRIGVMNAILSSVTERAGSVDPLRYE
jgi:hypothetical protein